MTPPAKLGENVVDSFKRPYAVGYRATCLPYPLDPTRQGYSRARRALANPSLIFSSDKVLNGYPASHRRHERSVTPALPAAGRWSMSSMARSNLIGSAFGEESL
jgi:hypothetical protein